MPSLFLSYRRSDSPDTVKLIYERLKKRLPRWDIFYDHESIPLGEQFPELLRAKVTSATVVLVIIGPKWVQLLHERKNAVVDHVRVEVRLALEATKSVLPIVVGHAAMPTEADLGDFADLQPLLERNGRPVRPDPDFDGDLERIVAHLQQLDSNESIGATLADKYTLTEEVGHGGMGVVYRAEQKQPVKRTVAVKLIKPGMDTSDVLARFDAERQALAVMDHPNIAKVHDGGMTARGRPFFVMEYVKGIPITQHCDEKKLTPQDRLELFIPVCDAVQHAHQKGIIHRDIKPSNVLVELINGKPIAKVIDFGLAKALGHKLTEKTLYTDVNKRVGTLEYSAPEQAAGRASDVDTRSDIYSLGVLLYELLTGAPPFSREELKLGEDEMRRVIREEEPATPSKKLSSSGELSAIAANRQLEPKKLTRLVQGDLDWIVMKCLEKEQARRDETATQLAQELQRYLADEPVEAGPPSTVYRLRKFVRRHKTGLLTMATLVLAVLLAASGIGWALWDHATQESARRVELAGRMAETEKAVTVALTKAEQSEERANKLPCRTSVEAKATLVEWREAAAALTEAEAALRTGAASDELRQRVAEVLQRITSGRNQAERKQKLFRELDDARMAMATWKESHFDFAGAAVKYAAAFAQFGLEVRSAEKDVLAQSIRRQAPAIRDALILALDLWAFCAKNPMKKDLLAIADAADDDAWRQDYRQAKVQQDVTTLVRLSKEARHLTLPPTSIQLLAHALYTNDQREEACNLLRCARGRHPSDYWIAMELGGYLGKPNAAANNPGDLEEQIGCYRVVVALRPDHSAAHNNLAFALYPKKHLDEAIAEWKKAIELDARNVLAHSNLGLALSDKKQLNEAISECKKAIDLEPRFAPAHNNLGQALYLMGQQDEAIGELKKAIKLDPNYAKAHYNLGVVLDGKNDLDGAIAELKTAIACNPKLVEAHVNLGLRLIDKNLLEEAITECKKAIELNPKVASAHQGLGVALYSKKQLDDAFMELKKATELDPNDAITYYHLGLILQDKNQLDDAIAQYKKAINLDSKLVEAHYDLGVALNDKNEVDGAIIEFKKIIALDAKFARAYDGLGSALAKKNQLNNAIIEFKKAIDLDPKFVQAHYNLGTSLYFKNQLEDAIAEFKKTIALDPNYTRAHHNLGIALASKNQLDDAIIEFKKVIALDPKSAITYNSLGKVLLQQGRFAQAEAAFKRCLELLSTNDTRRKATEQLIERTRRLFELDKKLPSILSGKTKPVDTTTYLDLCMLCEIKHLDLAGARFCKRALDERPALADALDKGLRYNAACFAALAAAGQGKDADKLTDHERADLRKQALQWLRADLAAWGKQFDKDGDKERSVVQGKMTHWKQDSDLAGVRDPKALEKLPPDERDTWQKLWKDVDALLAKTRVKK